MKRILIILGSLLAIVIVAGTGFLTLSSGLKSNLTVGLSPETHVFGAVDVRKFTGAPLGAEVKVFLPISPQEAMGIVADFRSYPKWVSPPPARVIVDNSGTNGGQFGVGSKVSYKEGESDIIEFHDRKVAMIARPLWGLEDFEGHRGVVIVSSEPNGSIMHMRRYFRVKSLKGWFMSKMMPIFMKNSAENLAKEFDGKVL